MKIADVIQALQKLAPIVGDADVVLQEIGQEAQTVIHSLSVDLDPSSGTASSVVTVKHGAPAEPEPEPEPEPADPPVDQPAA